jgi:hypothetical protein
MTDYNKLSKDITDWLKYNIIIDRLSNQIKSVKETKNKLESKILTNLKDNYLMEKKLKISNYHVYYNVSNSMPPLSSKLLEQVLDEYLTPQTKEKILNKLQLMRESNKTQTICLKKKNIKQSKQSKTLRPKHL